MLNDHLGYVKLDRFARIPIKNLKNALTELKEQGMLGLGAGFEGGMEVDLWILPPRLLMIIFLMMFIVFTKTIKEIDKSYATSKGF